MAETTEQFLERFRATGLDMLCEARRRANQTSLWYGIQGSGPHTGRTSGKHPAFGLSYGRSLFKSASVGMSSPDYFFKLDLSYLERRVMQSILGTRVEQSLFNLASAFDATAATLGDWKFYVSDPEEHEPQERILWPGVKAQVEGERKYNVKRVAKERLKKKLAKKRK